MDLIPAKDQMGQVLLRPCGKKQLRIYARSFAHTPEGLPLHLDLPGAADSQLQLRKLQVLRYNDAQVVGWHKGLIYFFVHASLPGLIFTAF